MANNTEKKAQLPAMTWDALDTLWTALRRMARDTSLTPGERGEAEVLAETVRATRNEAE